MQITYKILFSIEMLHEYFTDEKASMLSISPSDDTSALMKGLKILSKQLNNKMSLGISANLNKPKITIPAGAKFRFYLVADRHEFFNVTNFEPERGRILYFSNSYQNKTGTDLFISKQLPAFDGGTAYIKGNLVTSGTDVYEAIKPGTGNLPTNAAFWVKRAKSNYINSSPKIDFFASNITVNLAVPALIADIKILSYDSASNSFVTIISSETRKFTIPQSGVNIDISKLKPGRYLVDCNGNSRDFYKDESIPAATLGVIEIFNNLPVASDFSLINALGEFKTPDFKLRFANNLIYWKYRNAKTKLTAVGDFDAKYTFTLDGTDVIYDDFISDSPIPVTEQPMESFYAQSVLLDKISPIKNPDPNRMNQIIKDGIIYYCSDIYLNY